MFLCINLKLITLFLRDCKKVDSREAFPWNRLKTLKFFHGRAFLCTHQFLWREYSVKEDASGISIVGKKSCKRWMQVAEEYGAVSSRSEVNDFFRMGNSGAYETRTDS